MRMRTMMSLVVAGSLSVAVSACKKSDDRADQVSPKAVEESEKEAMDSREDVAEERHDVAEEKNDLGAEKAELREKNAEFDKQRDEFVAKAKEKMASLEARIDSIKANYDAHRAELKAEAREEMAELVNKLEVQRAEVRTAFDAAASGSEEKWNNLEKNTGEALDDLEETTDAAAGKLKDAGIEIRAKVEN